MNRLKQIALRIIVSRLIKAVTIDDLLRIELDGVYIGKRKLSREELGKLKVEASTFESTLLWKLMLNNLYWIANFKMISGANRERDMDNGRMMTHCIETIQEFINKLTKIR